MLVDLGSPQVRWKALQRQIGAMAEHDSQQKRVNLDCQEAQHDGGKSAA